MPHCKNKLIKVHVSLGPENVHGTLSVSVKYSYEQNATELGMKNNTLSAGRCRCWVELVKNEQT